MGDIADWMIDSQFDGDWVDDDMHWTEFHSLPRDRYRSRIPSSGKICNRCYRGGFRWIATSSGWRLGNDKGFHDCSPNAEQDFAEFKTP